MMEFNVIPCNKMNVKFDFETKNRSVKKISAIYGVRGKHEFGVKSYVIKAPGKAVNGGEMILTEP